jgi:hypothetical protein
MFITHDERKTPIHPFVPGGKRKSTVLENVAARICYDPQRIKRKTFNQSTYL